MDVNVLVVRSTLMRQVGGFDVTLRRMVDYDLVLRIADTVDLVHVPVIGALYDNDGADRISVREPWTLVRPREAATPDGLGSARAAAA